MTSSVHAASTMRKSARLALGYVAAACIAFLVLLGAFGREQAFGFEHVLLLAVLLSVTVTRIVMRSRSDAHEQLSSWFDFELGCLAFSATYALVQHAGGLTSPLYPVLYVVAALAGSFATRAHSRLLLLCAVLFEAPLYFFTEGQHDPKPYALHVLFMAFFGSISAVFTQAELARARFSTERERAEEKKRVTQEARLFRLAAKPPTTAARDEEHLWRSSVAEVQSAVQWNLQLLKTTLGLHTALLLLRDELDGHLRSVASATDSTQLWPGPFAPGEGAIGATYQRGVTTNLESVRPGHAGLCYYQQRTEPIRAFLAVPVREQGKVIGVLCADRIEDRAFTSTDERVLQGAVEHLLRALENERVFVQLEHSKREQDVLYEASQALGAALTGEAVLNAALSATGQLVIHDFAAVTHFDSQTRQHTIMCARGDGAERFADLKYRDNASLTAMVVKNRHYLPVRGELDLHNQTVFTRNEHLRGMQSVIVLPLCVRDAVIGTLVLAAKSPAAFPLDVRAALQLLANQAAVALSNAASVARLEELATTDGLTGCYNKRHFHAELLHRLHSATRHGKKVSLLIADIDHFKSVNDKYGHQTGDIVIRELGQILKRLRRGSDIVARFGGEEFCVLCDETSTEGALQLAERVRVELGKASFETEHGPLKVTCSLGVATYPDHGASDEKLFEAADRALYAAKHAGRNQVRSP